MSLRVLNPNAEVLNKSAALHMNINAAKGLQDVLKSNLGPKGTIKMYDNEIICIFVLFFLVSASDFVLFFLFFVVQACWRSRRYQAHQRWQYPSQGNGNKSPPPNPEELKKFVEILKQIESKSKN